MPSNSQPGECIHQLYDDYLLLDTGAAMLDAIRRAGPDEPVLLFGAQIAHPDSS